MKLLKQPDKGVSKMLKLISNTFLLFSLWVLMGCGKITGWFPGWDNNSSNNQPSKGCNKDVRVHYKNTCSKNLIIYFIEIVPGTTFNCESLEDYGTIVAEQSETIVVHKGRIGYFVFAEDQEGKCSSAHRKGEAWVNCEQSPGDDAYFNICP